MVNGKKTLRQLLAEVEKFDLEAEIERRVEERLEEERARQRAERAREAEQKMLGVKRSKLTPLEKSRIIESRGREFYESLPWD